MKWAFLLCSALQLGLTGNLWAGQVTPDETAAAGPMRLTLQQAVELALAPDGAARLRLANEIARQSQALKRQALADLLPNLEGRTEFQSFTRNLEAFGIGAAGALPVPFPRSVGPIETVDVRATVSQTVFDFAALRRYQAAGKAAQAASLEAEWAKTRTLEEVARAYLSALRGQAAAEAARINLHLSERLLALAESQKRAGTGTGIEVTRAQAVLAADRQALEEAESALRSALLHLKRLIGLDMETALELVSQMENRPAEEVPARQAIEKARRLRADWRAQHRRLEAARLAYSAWKWSRLPSLRAYADYGAIGRTETGLLPTRTAAFQAQIPLWNGGRREAQRAESLSRVRQEEIRLEDLADQLELEIRTALERSRSAEAQVRAAEEALRLAEAELEQAQRRYEAGVATSLEVTEAQSRLQRARSSRIEALYQQNQARIDLAASLGAIEEILQ